MRGMNRVTLFGFLGQDPKFTDIGQKKFCNLSVGTPDSWRDGQGQMQERVEWHKVVLTGHSADFANQYAKKSQWVLIEGRNQTREWTDTQGVKRHITEIWADSFELVPAGGDKHNQLQGNYQNDDYQSQNNQQRQQPQQSNQQRQQPQQGDYQVYDYQPRGGFAE